MCQGRLKILSPNHKTKRGSSNKTTNPVLQSLHVSIFRHLVPSSGPGSDQGGRVVQVEVVEQPKVDEAEHGRVELDKDGHQLEVNALRPVIGKAVRHHPGDCLAHYLGLEVVPLDGDEHLAKGSEKSRLLLV